MSISSFYKSIVLLFISAASPLYGDVAFFDDRGQLLEFSEPPQRVVSIVRSAPIIYGVVDETASHMVGMNLDTFSRYFGDNVYSELLPAVGKLATSAAQDGFVPNVEAILGMKPDAVIQWSTNPDFIEPLERVGLTVVGWGCCSKEDRLGYIWKSAYMSGRIDRAQKLIELQRESDSRLEERWATVEKDEFASILVVDQLNDQIRVVANGSDDFSLSGAVNLAADETDQWWKTVDLEQILAWNPEFIIIPPYAKSLSVQDFYKHPLLRSVAAIKNRQVYKVPLFALTPDAPEIYLNAAWAARVFHGSEVESGFRDEMKKAYSTAYGVDLSQQQWKNILSVDENSDSRNYSELFD